MEESHFFEDAGVLESQGVKGGLIEDGRDSEQAKDLGEQDVRGEFLILPNILARDVKRGSIVNRELPPLAAVV